MKVHMLTRMDREGLRFSTTVTPLRQPVPPVDSFLETLRKPSDARTCGMSKGMTWKFWRFRLRSCAARPPAMSWAVQCPTELRNKPLGMKDDFFGSSRIVWH